MSECFAYLMSENSNDKDEINEPTAWGIKKEEDEMIKKLR